MPREEELWERVAKNVEKQFRKQYLLKIYPGEGLAGLYKRRFDRGVPVKLVSGEWPPSKLVHELADIIVYENKQKVRVKTKKVYEANFSIVTIHEKMKKALEKGGIAYAERYFPVNDIFNKEGYEYREYYFSMEPTIHSKSK